MRIVWPRTREHWCARRQPVARAGGGQSTRRGSPAPRSSDVDDIWPETARVREDARQVPCIGQIEAQVLLNPKGESAARQFKAPDCFSVADGAVRRTGTHTEKWKAASASEGLEVATGVGDTIHLVEGIGKVRDPGRSTTRGNGRGRGHSASVCARAANQKWIRLRRLRQERTATGATHSTRAANLR
jgi:hypothetical protein